MKVALYARVSTAEQRDHGLSIEAQTAALRAWAKREGHYIAGEYIDAGISGKRPPAKRPELSRFFSDLDAGLKVDALAFCRLDRFFRSVRLYYQAVEVLDRHHVAWQAIQEDYETVTASGRMKVNIMLSVAENEADRTSERIKSVFERKVEKGEALTRCQPFGLKVEGKKVVPSEYAPAALEAFQMFAATGNTYAIRDMIQTKYGVRLPYEAVYRFLRNPLYKGEYRGNPNYCQPIVPAELFEQVQADLARRATKKTPSGRVYLFSGLIVCGTCGRKMTVSPGCRQHLHPERYRCPGHLMGKTCTNNHTFNEYKIEQHFLDVVSSAMAGITVEYKVAKKEKPPVNRAAINQKLTRLKELYIDGDISKAEYSAQKAKLQAVLDEAPATIPAPGFREIIGSDFREQYEAMNRDQRRTFWRGVVDHVTIFPDRTMDIYFLP